MFSALGRATYRRRRAVAVAVALTLAVAGWRLVPALGAAFVREQPVAPASPGSYVVQPDDTLWSIAERVGSGRDVRAVVAELIAANGGDVVHPGQRLTLPASLGP